MPPRLLRLPALLLAALTGGCLFPSGPALSPGELPPRDESPERAIGDDSPSDRSIAVIVNRRGLYLLCVYTRPPGTVAAIGGAPSGGKRALSPREFDYMMSIAPPDPVLASMTVHQHCFETIEYAYGRATGLRWTLPLAIRRADESAWDAALRAAQENAGVPPEKLRQEFHWLDERTRTSYFRLRYTGSPDDRFLVYDPAIERGEAFHTQSAWIAKGDPPVVLLASYLVGIDGLEAEPARILFDLPEPKRLPAR